MYGRPRRVLRGVALLAAATVLAVVPAHAPPGKTLAPPAAAGPTLVASSSPAPYWPVAWLEGTPTRPNGFPSVDHLPTDDVVILPPPETFDAPPAPAEPPPAALAAAPARADGAGVWAVVIGINDYPGRRSDLRSATADARDVDAVLDRHGVPPEQRLLLLDRQAPAATIRLALDWLVANAGSDATAVVYYAGHVRKLGDTTQAIVAADGGLVTDADVAARLAPLRAANTWLAFASCFGAGFDEALAPGRVLTAASGANSLAYENHAYNRSYLGEYLVRRALLEGRADRSVQQAFAWAADQLRRDHPNRVPVMIDHAGGEVTLGTPAPPPPAAPPPPPPDDRTAPPSTTSTTTEPERRCAVRVGSVVTCRDG